MDPLSDAFPTQLITGHCTAFSVLYSRTGQSSTHLFSELDSLTIILNHFSLKMCLDDTHIINT